MSDDDESPRIDMDGNIKENSPESPTSYSRPATPEINKLSSLMVSSPSTDSPTSPNPKEDSFYEKLQEYYELKEEYDQKLRDAHRRWNNSKPPMSLEKKKENYQNFMINRKCINCGNGPGGTIFSQVGIGKNRKLTAKCGCEEKCNLNIEIYMGESLYLPEYIDYYKERVLQLKREVSEYKYDLLFNLRDEEVVLNEFTTIKDQLAENLDKLLTFKKFFDKKNENIELLGNTLEIFQNMGEELVQNEEGEYKVSRKKFVHLMQKHLNYLVSEFKTKTNDYKKTPSSVKLKENFNFLKNSVLKIQDAIRNEKYHVIYMDTIENNAKKGFKKQKIMDTYVFNPSKYKLSNQILTQGNKITQFKR